MAAIILNALLAVAAGVGIALVIASIAIAFGWLVSLALHCFQHRNDPR